MQEIKREERKPLTEHKWVACLSLPINAFRKIPCSTKFLRESNFAGGRFFVSCGTNFCHWERLAFLSGYQFFAIFMRSRSTGIITFSSFI